MEVAHRVRDAHAAIAQVLAQPPPPPLPPPPLGAAAAAAAAVEFHAAGHAVEADLIEQGVGQRVPIDRLGGSAAAALPILDEDVQGVRDRKHGVVRKRGVGVLGEAVARADAHRLVAPLPHRLRPERPPVGVGRVPHGGGAVEEGRGGGLAARRCAHHAVVRRRQPRQRSRRVRREPRAVALVGGRALAKAGRDAKEALHDLLPQRRVGAEPARGVVLLPRARGGDRVAPKEEEALAADARLRLVRAAQEAAALGGLAEEDHHTRAHAAELAIDDLIVAPFGDRLRGEDSAVARRPQLVEGRLQALTVRVG